MARILIVGRMRAKNENLGRGDRFGEGLLVSWSHEDFLGSLVDAAFEGDKRRSKMLVGWRNSPRGFAQGMVREIQCFRRSQCIEERDIFGI